MAVRADEENSAFKPGRKGGLKTPINRKRERIWPKGKRFTRKGMINRRSMGPAGGGSGETWLVSLVLGIGVE